MASDCLCGTPLDECEDCGSVFCPSCDGECTSAECLDDEIYYPDGEIGEPFTYHSFDDED